MSQSLFLGKPQVMESPHLQAKESSSEIDSPPVQRLENKHFSPKGTNTANTPTKTSYGIEECKNPVKVALKIKKYQMPTYDEPELIPAKVDFRQISNYMVRKLYDPRPPTLDSTNSLNSICELVKRK